MRTVDVLVVGAGAAGLAAAATLGHYGVATLLVEQRRSRRRCPRATVISTRSMELLRAWGLEDEVLAGGVDADVWLWECATLAARRRGQRPRGRLPESRAGGRSSARTAPGTVPQDWLEAVLRRHVAIAAGGSLRARHRSSSPSTTRPDGVRATLRDAAGDAAHVRARYLVAADGAHSAVRGHARRRACRSGTGALRRRAGGVPRAAVAAARRPPLRALRRHDAGGAGPVPPGGPRRPLGVRPGAAGRGRRARADLDPARLADAIRRGAGSSTSTRASSASGRSTRRASWRTGSASAGRSSSATPRTG